MTYRSPERLFCPDCQGLLVYMRRSQGKVVEAFHVGQSAPEGYRGKVVKATRLPHTKRTLDRARREARRHIGEATE